jgi:hypothetical protein
VVWTAIFTGQRAGWEQAALNSQEIRRIPPVHTMTDEDLHAVLAAVHADLASADLDDTPDLDPSLAACTQLALSRPRRAWSSHSRPCPRST